MFRDGVDGRLADESRDVREERVMSAAREIMVLLVREESVQKGHLHRYAPSDSELTRDSVTNDRRKRPATTKTSRKDPVNQ